jgi:hypothetical protein
MRASASFAASRALGALFGEDADEALDLRPFGEPMSFALVDRDDKVFGNLLSARESAQCVELSGMIEHVCILRSAVRSVLMQINMRNWGAACCLAQATLLAILATCAP